MYDGYLYDDAYEPGRAKAREKIKNAVGQQTAGRSRQIQYVVGYGFNVQSISCEVCVVPF